MYSLYEEAGLIIGTEEWERRQVEKAGTEEKDNKKEIDAYQAIPIS